MAAFKHSRSRSTETRTIRVNETTASSPLNSLALLAVRAHPLKRFGLASEVLLSARPFSQAKPISNLGRSVDLTRTRIHLVVP
jgi:hypothetical protein